VNDTSTDRRRPGVLRLAAGVTGVLLLAIGGWFVVRQQSAPQFEAAGELPVDLATAPATPGAAGSSADPSTGAGAGAMVDASFAPQRLQVPKLDVDAPIQPVGVESTGNLVIPNDPQVIGWWSGGAAPGSPVGTVLMASHVDSAKDGPGALARLAQTPIGAQVTVRGSAGSQTYQIAARRRYFKGDLPWRQLFNQGMQPRLVLVTCGGEFDYRTRHYTDNIVVVATPVTAR
jgi:Sortase domain